MREKARGDEKNLTQFVLGIDRTPPMQSILGYHFNETKPFIKVESLFRITYLDRKIL